MDFAILCAQGREAGPCQALLSEFERLRQVEPLLSDILSSRALVLSAYNLETLIRARETAEEVRTNLTEHFLFKSEDLESPEGGMRVIELLSQSVTPSDVKSTPRSRPPSSYQFFSWCRGGPGAVRSSRLFSLRALFRRRSIVAPSSRGGS